jgi:aminoglycoside phosphotransferase (APT) family kinase protein
VILEGAGAEARVAQYFESIGEPDAAISGLRPLAHGWETNVYAFTRTQGEHLQERVLRIYCGDNVAERAAGEFRIMQALGAAGYPVPEVFRYESDPNWFGGPFILMERVQGRLLRERYDSADPAGRRALVSLFCQLLVRLHGLDAPALLGADARAVSFDPTWLGAMLRASGLAEAFGPVLDWLTQFGATIKPEPCLIHGDFHSDNILVAEDGAPAVIDWSAGGIADRRTDLAQTVILLMDQYRDPEIAMDVRRGYESLIGRELSHFAYFEALVIARRLMIMLAGMVSGTGSVGLRPGLEEELRASTGHLRLLCSQLRERTGLPMTAIEDVIARFE